MTCSQPRDEYIQAVRNVVAATRALAHLENRFLDDLKSLPPDTPPRDGLGEWHLCTDALARLIAEQNEAFASYDTALKRHR